GIDLLLGLLGVGAAAEHQSDVERQRGSLGARGHLARAVAGIEVAVVVEERPAVGGRGRRHRIIQSGSVAGGYGGERARSLTRRLAVACLQIALVHADANPQTHSPTGTLYKLPGKCN